MDKCPSEYSSVTSAAPVAVQAMRARRAALLEVVERNRSKGRLAAHLIASPTANATEKQWAEALLSSRRAK